MTYTTKWLRAEGAAVLLAVLFAYAVSGGSWLVFLGLLLLPDLSMAGYLVSPRAGAVSYNLIHIYAWPAFLLGLWAAGAAPWTLTVGLVWAAHIAMDRALGYGLKEPHSFQQTHLGAIGGAPSAAASTEG